MKRNDYFLGVFFVLFVVVALGCGQGDESATVATPEIVIANLDVAGMTCESCEAAIRETVGGIEGVYMVEAHHDPGEATVSFDPSLTSIEAVTVAIEGMGYTVVDSSSSSGAEEVPSESS